MSRRKADKTKELADRTPFERAEVQQYGDVAVALGKTTEQLASDVADAMDLDYDEEGRRRPQEKTNDKLAALQGLTDDPAGRVAEAVYAQVFAATWVKRQDLSAERKCTAARSEASTASTMARSAYAAEIKGTIEVGA